MNKNDSLIVISKKAQTMREALGVSLQREVEIYTKVFATNSQPRGSESSAEVAARISREMDLNPAEIFLMGMQFGAAISNIQANMH